MNMQNFDKKKKKEFWERGKEKYLEEEDMDEHTHTCDHSSLQFLKTQMHKQYTQKV